MSNTPFSVASGGLRVRVRLSPKASRNGITGVEDAGGSAVLKVAVTAAPEGGKANAALIRLLAKAWRLPRTSLAVTAGRTARRKTLFIAGDTDALLGRLNQWTEQNNG